MGMWQARRIGVIIRPEMDARMGRNVQGPSMIRVPDWVRGALGRYYLYFADHKGSYIRLAYAASPEGPWRMHEPGSLDLRESLYPTEPPVPPLDVSAAKVDRLPGAAPPGTPGMLAPELEASHPHIASPDVHVDHSMHRIVMYYHGLAGYRTQRTRVAVSPDGVNFTPREALLGSSYFRVFAHGGATYAVVMPGLLMRAEDPFGPFEPGPDLFGDPNQRHTALLKRGDTLFVFWTRVGDVPERILVSRVELHGDWRDWRAGPAEEVLRPEMEWEGARLPAGRSWRGAINIPVNQLRDPCILDRDGHAVLLYAVAGEAGIAIAELHGP